MNKEIDNKDSRSDAIKSFQEQWWRYLQNKPFDFEDCPTVPDPQYVRHQSITQMLYDIEIKEPLALEVINDIIKHVHATYGDKYQSDVTEWLDTKALLLSKDGKYACIHNAAKYLQRFSSTGFEKSGNIEDIRKAIHYLIFLLQRDKIQKNKDDNEKSDRIK